MYFHVYLIYRSFIRHHKMLGVRIAKRKIEPQKPANPCGTRLCSCIFSVNTRQLKNVPFGTKPCAASFLSRTERFFVSTGKRLCRLSGCLFYLLRLFCIHYKCKLGAALRQPLVLFQYSSAMISTHLSMPSTPLSNVRW